jgi:2-methylcitrate dehydratase PrpD
MSTTERAQALAPQANALALCETIARWRYENLPAPVVQMLKALLLDEIGVIAGAANAPGIPELNARLGRWETQGSATGLIGKRRYSPPSAALANGAAGHALDYDDQHDPARVHTNCVVVPTLLAAAEDAGPIDGKNFLLGHAVGAELHARLGLACYNSLGKGWHPTMVFGTLAAALGAGRMMNLDTAGLRDALGIAYHQASGSAQSMRDGVLTKRLGAGFAARAAVLGVFLAADGISGTRRTLEGNAGLFSLYERDEVKPEILMQGLGSEWRIPEYSLKPYPCCRCNHSAIDLGIGLHVQGMRAEHIASVEICMGHVNWLTVGEPYDPVRNEIVHAQFNAAYGFARALTDGRVDLRSYTRPNITDSRIAALTAVTRIIDDASIDATAIEPVRIRLTLKDGRTIEMKTDTVKGSPRDPMSDQERMAKFYDCLEFGLGADKSAAGRLADVLLNIEREPDAAGAIVAAFPPAGR